MYDSLRLLVRPLVNCRMTRGNIMLVPHVNVYPTTADPARWCLSSSDVDAHYSWGLYKSRCKLRTLSAWIRPLSMHVCIFAYSRGSIGSSCFRDDEVDGFDFGYRSWRAKHGAANQMQITSALLDSSVQSLLLVTVFWINRILIVLNINPLQANWFKAAEYCFSLGMQLAITNSKEDHDRIVEAVKASPIYNAQDTIVFLGGNDLGEEGVFYWHSTGVRLAYAHWQSGQPDNWKGIEDCVALVNIPGWNWVANDGSCESVHYFVCENVESIHDVGVFW